MGAITQAVYDRMAGDPVLTGLLPTYRGSPAIFTYDPIPGGAELPLIVSSGDVAAPTDVPESTKQTVGARITRDIRIFADADGSKVQVERIAERVWELFEKVRLNIPEWETVLLTRADRPIMGASDERAYLLVVTITISISREGVS